MKNFKSLTTTIMFFLLGVITSSLYRESSTWKGCVPIFLLLILIRIVIIDFERDEKE